MPLHTFQSFLSRCFPYAAILLLLILSSCVEEEEFANNPTGNFEALWKIMDEHYCFFKEKNVDWNQVHERYRVRIRQDMTDRQLFEVLGDMLAELRDGHVNLYTSFDTNRYWEFHEDYPKNFSQHLVDHYLGTDCKIAGGMRYKILDDNIGYLRCGSFAGTPGTSTLDAIMLYFASCNGLIIDLRGNGGGILTSAEKLAARFTNEEIPVGYIKHKTGKGHHDFSKPEMQYLKPAKGSRWQKKVVVLTNREVYSAANEFVKYMKCCPLATILGEQTGGGGGMPFTSELPNGWLVRFSACPMYDKDGNNIEDGIQPDIHASFVWALVSSNIDTIIETARELINKDTKKDKV